MIKTRFAPSPTGSLHIGGLRTALYSYALSKSKGGKFVLRIEDTDKKREIPGSKEKIAELLKMFGLVWDEYFVQSERASKGVYKKAAEKLVSDGHAFYCQCPAKNAKQGFSKDLRDPCREKGYKEGAVKLKVPDGEKIAFRDFVLNKDVTWETSLVPDTTLLKTDGFPTYHLAVVVDDNDMEITHALRGHDWMPSTPVHLLVYKYLDYKMPEIGHLTDILDPEGGKLSKRKGSTSCEGLLKEGYLPEAILNFVMLLGWAPKDNRELFTLKDFVGAFDTSGFQKSNPVFNREKLDWFNGYYIRAKSDSELVELLLPFAGDIAKEKLEKIAPLIKDRIKKLSEFREIAGFFAEVPEVTESMLGKNYSENLTLALEVIEEEKDWNVSTLNASLLAAIGEKGIKTGDFFMDLRIALTGRKITPPVAESIIILGKEETKRRLNTILEK